MCEVAGLVACKRFQNKPSNRCEHVFNELCYEGLRQRLSIKQNTLDLFHDRRPAPLFFLAQMALSPLKETKQIRRLSYKGSEGEDLEPSFAPWIDQPTGIAQTWIARTTPGFNKGAPLREYIGGLCM